jgi:hypothetical protein
MKPFSLITDSYDRKARLYPALLLVVPVLIVVVGVGLATFSILKSLGTVAAGCGGAFLLSQLARDAGKKLEVKLFEKWGGLPSVAILRHRDVRIDAITKNRYHKHLSTLVKGTKPPTPKEEDADPTAADQVYTAWSSYLRVHTRNTKTYPLVFQENVSYGYRRNVCGLRPLGIGLSALSLASGAGWLYRTHVITGSMGTESVASLLCVFVFLLLWIFRFTPDWVRIPADAYAQRLVESVDSLKSAPSSSKTSASKGTA